QLFLAKNRSQKNNDICGLLFCKNCHSKLVNIQLFLAKNRSQKNNDICGLLFCKNCHSKLVNITYTNVMMRLIK
ncbi:MAG: hypothetical protein WBQ73_01250, partial [Candidatus Babeliales bacterium]